jgi:hypothetical protein
VWAPGEFDRKGHTGNQGKKALNSGGKIVLADGLNGGVAAIGVELAHDAMNVVFDGEF